ncbi:hypothetical protein QBC33DRAFT_516343 [Phialemonium atrogriseum]|uniref:Uncharacterized protein n=1 Tax=Phialemonium atrogriseum TaxID=1093897 RepID=A0AAJ0BX50_9PEZI|nr:uncharacterized protein QBC33DRAFT_516343 [Phialemonium atrogriseum]KAK1765925.1 hypothetical protein QBC33DRAFT_516343 [Phialemonium atrogriseum]
MGAPDHEPAAQMVDNVVRAIQNLTTDANYKIVSEVFNEVIFLKDRNNKLSVAQRETFEEYRHFRNELEERVDAKDKEINQLNDAKAVLTAEKTSLESQVEQKEKEITDLTDTKTRLEGEKTALESTVETKNKEVADLTEAKTQLTDEKAALQSTLEEKAKEIQELTETKARLEGEKSDLESTVEAKDKEIGELNAAKTQLADEKASLESQLQEKTKELAELTDAKTKLEEEKAALDTKLEEKEKELTELVDAKSKLETEVAELKEAKSKLEKDLEEANKKLEDQRKEAEDAAAAAAKEISSLQEKIAEKDAELKGVREELSSLQGELKEMTEKAEGETSRANTLQGELDTVTAKANDATARVEFLELELKVVTGKAEEANATVDRLQSELREKIERLTELEGYRVALKSESEDAYVEILDRIWTHIAGLVETQFRQDLDPGVLADASCWAKLRACEHLKHPRQMPLPQSNTSAAKQMRVAAVLAVLSRSLHRHVFRPVYLIDDEDGGAATPTGHGAHGSHGVHGHGAHGAAGGHRDSLARLLQVLDADSPAREAHFRATLLAALPERQRASAARRARTVAREVSWLVQELLGAAQYDSFCGRLEAACTLACAQWMRIQRSSVRIEAYFGPPYDHYDWQVLPLPQFDGDGGRDGGREVVVRHDGDGEGALLDDNDDVVVEVGRPAADEDEPRPRPRRRVRTTTEDNGTAVEVVDDDDDEEGPELGPEDIMLVVWPSMCAVEGGQLESITQGLVISKDQVRAAQEELRGRGRNKPSTKRARTLSMPGRGVSGSVGKSFLAAGDGGASNNG